MEAKSSCVKPTRLYTATWSILQCVVVIVFFLHKRTCNMCLYGVFYVGSMLFNNLLKNRVVKK